VMRATVVAIIGIIAAAGLAAGYTYMWGAPQEPGEPGGNTTQPETNTSQGPKGPGAGGPPAQAPAGGGGGPPNTAPGGPPEGHEDNATRVCDSIGNMTVRDSIQWLLDNHNLYNYTLSIYPDNKTIIWIITGPNKTTLEILYYHILQMKCVIENGATPRPQDPLFVVDAQISSKYVNTTVEFINDTAIKVVKVAENDCAFQVILLHAEVVKGFFETGRLEASNTHEIPEDVAQTCAPYLENP